MPNTQRVYIGGLANDARERDVEKFFKGYGKFGEVSMKQGYGFVDFEDYRDADDAVHDLNGKDLLGERYWSDPSLQVKWLQSYGIILRINCTWVFT